MKHSPFTICSHCYQKIAQYYFDFSNAIVQSSLPEPIYLEFSPGYASPKATNHVYKVSNSLYVNIRAAKLWYKHLQNILVYQLKFTISTVDSCLFIREGIVFIFLVDDGIIV
jgi:hypothetical protein